MATRDPEATKARLLDAALHEFSSKGISGARVDAIAARAKTNKRMLYYYFGSKDDLYREVLRRSLTGRIDALLGADVTGDGRIAERFARVEPHHDYVRMLMWEALENPSADAVEEEPERRAFYQLWVERIRAAQRAGEIADDLDPAEVVLAEIALTVFPLAFPQVTRMVTGSAEHDPEFASTHATFLHALGARLNAQPSPTAITSTKSVGGS